jgi:hypothetical protein
MLLGLGFVIHESEQQFVVGVNDGVIVQALPVDDAEPSELPYADVLFVERLEEAFLIGESLQREYAQGRAALIAAQLVVNV